jgi:hypothetical protein
MEPETQSLELLETPDPSALLPDSAPILLWIAIAATILIAALITFLILRRKKAPTTPAQLREIARQQAAEALTSATPKDPRDAAIQVSLIIRRYLSLAASDPALFETHEEFISRRDSLTALNETARQTCEERFAWLASLKYGREIPSLPPDEILAQGKTLLETLHHGFSS